MVPANIRRNASDVGIQQEKAWIDSDEHGQYKEFTCLAQGRRSAKAQLARVGKVRRGKRKSSAKYPRPKGPYVVRIKLYGDMRKDGVMRPANPSHKAWVHCGCPYFLYYVEVAVTARGSSNVITSNGAYPKIRNPRMKPYLCKHILKAVKRAVSKKATLRESPLPNMEEAATIASIYQDFIP